MDQPIMSAEEHPGDGSSPFFKRWNTANDPTEMITPPQTPPEMSLDGTKVGILPVYLSLRCKLVFVKTKDIFNQIYLWESN